MKQLLLLYFFLVFAGIRSFSQKENNNWIFGNKAGVSFKTGVPVALPPTAMNQLEGCSSISDKNGELLFYTDGVSVWDKNNTLMPNGNGLHGSFSSTQSAFIVPKPLSSSIYYIFTAGAQGGGLAYSIVNMHLNNGLGDVQRKNIFLNALVEEKIAVSKHANNRDIWVITHLFDGKKTFAAYLVTPDSVSTTPVLSKAGTTIVYQDFYTNNSIGALKASPAGDKLAYLVPRYGLCELYKFDKSTGVVSHAQRLLEVFNPTSTMESGDVTGGYGAEFSPNGRMLYITTGFKLIFLDGNFDPDPGGQFITQYNISSGNEEKINDSRNIVLNNAPDSLILGQMQLGPDNKIYFANYSRPYLGVINNPDVYGPGCNASFSGPSIAPGKSTLGLPLFFNYNANTLPLTLVDFSGSINSSVAILTWLTTAEINTGHFTISRSYDGSNFVVAGQVQATGNSSTETNYTFKDDLGKLAVFAHVWYYRLDEYDKDGTVALSRIIKINVPFTQYNLKLSPNPVVNFLHITGKALSPTSVATITDISGKTIKTTSLHIGADGSSVIDVSSLPPGNYFLRIESNAGAIASMFTKL